MNFVIVGAGGLGYTYAASFARGTLGFIDRAWRACRGTRQARHRHKWEKNLLRPAATS